MARRSWKKHLPTIRNYALLLLLSVATAFSLRHQVAGHLAKAPTPAPEFFFFDKGFSSYIAVTRHEWRPRILSNYLGSLAVEGTNSPGLPVKLWADRVGIWTGAWFFLICLVFLIGHPAQAMPLIFGTFTGIMAGYNPVGLLMVFPWDLPALFGSTLLCSLALHRRFRTMLVVLPALIAFKESLVVFCVCFLFWEGKKRHFAKKATALALAGCVGVKLAVDLMTSNPHPLFTPSVRFLGYKDMRLLVNLRYLAKFYENFALWINSGMLFGLPLLPTPNQDAKMLKLVAAAFVLGIFVTGNVFELRIWFEAVPMFLFCAFAVKSPGTRR